ncbi:methylenetetrahydrofolate--tRNA-(uracil(54)-C(5))-methyltransferase (FADH(2)-oxidizing) TrmFO [Dubosiella newyorkensis]|jgi:methylenetetrahydrofolate--tRNA-(uracil-5-)-methyltransferase|uniref:Methylenetetrahydrofolate--tRNA-(uracil-5-)-methyltransferase TrmFO n=5 Tax=Dubosiella newyorkensis TaxID=1862672 RepID=A0A1U7NNN6_9FIRM|nr:methylenetetrahydrofolate--tRNA-(uracil(54)-C(5))-methyltransferase (FADH(2)-oxidizing) TrmFO [Dubosiella newyorkensis]MCI9041192.1 methylenetetrahydrofolate--tRNA-(uracil(54)-C(5))-methyltransferase (FADH(2)-oxidizing) TrmFO [Dubosiella newyorkensis]OLU46918.1 methylenetetrahydrofolate--tRNA-(uracil(54)-C(5))-methyltransferase (FADH(2)-oxidizing) TrmFO [Dubosiella newyorkensis]
MKDKEVTVIGAGLAGSEAAWQLAKRGIQVRLIEMRPHSSPPAFSTGQFAELVCSNSLRSNSLNNAVGILKEEMRQLDSLIMKSADLNQVPAGSALAVDRHKFSEMITQTLSNHPNITIVHEEVREIPEGPVIIASGPLTSEPLAKAIQAFTDEHPFHFFDAAAPILEKDSIDFSKAYFKSRYDKGEASYINCPMDQQQFDTFYEALIAAECAHLHEFEQEVYFEGCMPIEEMARRGKKTLLFGPLKPVGLEREGEHPVAVVQLRQDNVAGSLYNIVGFQTHLTWPEQRRVFSMIPGLENAKITRYGVMHRNSFLDSPKILKETYQTKKREDLFFAGQMTGVEGYVESAASGLIAGINMARYIQGKECIEFENTCVMGSQAYYITHCDSKNFQPMNANFGILRAKEKYRKKEKKERLAKQALDTIQSIKERLDE